MKVFKAGKKTLLLSILLFSFESHANLINECFNLETAQNYQKALQVGLKAIKMEPNFYSYFCVASNYYNLGYYKQTIAYLKKAEQYALSKKELANIYSFEGRSYVNEGRLNKGLFYLNMAFHLDKAINNVNYEASDLNNIALVYADSQNFNQALKYYNKALNLIDNNQKGAIYNNIAMIYYTEKKYNKAINYQLNALKIDKKVFNYYGVATDYLNLGNDYIAINNFSKAKYYILKGLEMEKNISNNRWLGNAYIELSKLYLKENKLNKAKENLDIAKKYFVIANDQPGINLANEMLLKLNSNVKQ